MIDNKNQQLERKDAELKDLREKMVVQRKKDALEIASLADKLSAADKSALGQMKELLAKSDYQQTHATSKALQRNYENLTRLELSNALEEKDGVIRELRVALEGGQSEKKLLLQKRDELVRELASVNNDLVAERNRSEVQANRKELARLRKEVEEKRKKNEEMQKAIQEFGNRMMQYEKEKMEDRE